MNFLSMPDYGIFSLLPSLVAIGLALLTRRILLSLLLGIFTGYLLLAEGEVWRAIQYLLYMPWEVLSSWGNAFIAIFTFFIGALIALMQKSGGMHGFMHRLESLLLRTKKAQTSTRRVQFSASILGAVLFIESNISLLVVGMLYRPIFDKLRLSRERLAYICDATSAPSCILIPFNAWGGAILAILHAQGFPQPVATLFEATFFNFYAQAAIGILLLSIFLKKI